MENFQFLAIIASILGLLLHVALLVGAIMLRIKRKNTGTLMMLLGSILMIVNLFVGYLLPILYGSIGVENLANSIQIQQILGQIPFMIYFAGLITYAISLPKREL